MSPFSSKKCVAHSIQKCQVPSSTLAVQGQQTNEKAHGNKSSEPDKISPKVLNEFAEDVTLRLTFIFTTSLETGRISHQRKTALVACIFKMGDRNNATDYRPVSLMSIYCKLCMHIIAESIMHHREDCGLLTDSQTQLQSKEALMLNTTTDTS